MSIIVPSRRSFLAGLVSALAAPAIVCAENMMRVRALALDLTLFVDQAAKLGGDGSAARPFKTIQDVVDHIAKVPLIGLATIELASGVYRGRTVLPENVETTLAVRGPKMVDLQGEIVCNNQHQPVFDVRRHGVLDFRHLTLPFPAFNLYSGSYRLV